MQESCFGSLVHAELHGAACTNCRKMKHGHLISLLGAHLAEATVHVDSHFVIDESRLSSACYEKEAIKVSDSDPETYFRQHHFRCYTRTAAHSILSRGPLTAHSVHECSLEGFLDLPHLLYFVCAEHGYVSRGQYVF